MVIADAEHLHGRQIASTIVAHCKYKCPNPIITQHSLAVSPQTVCGYRFNKPNFLRADRFARARRQTRSGANANWLVRTASSWNWVHSVSLRISHPLISYQPMRRLVTLLFASFCFFVRCRRSSRHTRPVRACANSGPLRCEECDVCDFW